MNAIDVKQLVEQAIAREWPGFAADHPHLAAVLDADLLVATTTARLEDDPEYRDAMARAAAAGMAADAVADLVQRLVGGILRRIV